MSVLLAAANLRPAITAVGPVLPLIKDDVGLSNAALGLLGAVPVVAFAVVSPVVHRLVDRFGVDRTVAAALLLLAVGTVVRSWPGAEVNLWAGTVLVGATIAVANVCLPVVLKRDFARSTARTTGLYVACMSVFAALASGLAVPIADLSGLGWRLSLAAWVLPAVLALLVWLPRTAAPRGSSGGSLTHVGISARPSGSVWRSGLAWQLAAYMGLQSTAFYVVITWLPTVEQDLGVGAAEAGWHLFLLQMAQIVGNLGAPVLMGVGADQRLAAVVPGALLVTSMVGLVLAPALVLLWCVGTGLATGASFVIALSLVGMRAEDAATAGRLSAMTQGVGYAVAGTGLVLAGVLRDIGGSGPAVLLQVAAVGALVAVLGVLVGRDRVLRT